MTTFAGMLRKIQQFDPIEAAAEAIKGNEKAIIEVNQEQLYDYGIGKDGQELPPYSPAYGKIKQKQRGKSIVDIYRKGTLYNEMDLTIEGDTYQIFSKVPYAQFVVGKRPTIFGLTDEGKRTAWSIIRPDFVIKFKQSTGL